MRMATVEDREFAAVAFYVLQLIVPEMRGRELTREECTQFTAALPDSNVVSFVDGLQSAWERNKQ